MEATVCCGQGTVTERPHRILTCDFVSIDCSPFLSKYSSPLPPCFRPTVLLTQPFSCPLARRRDRALSEPAPQTLSAFLIYFELLRLLGWSYKMFAVLDKLCALIESSGTGKGQDTSYPTKVRLDYSFANFFCSFLVIYYLLFTV